jgi:hypothetical protein
VKDNPFVEILAQRGKEPPDTYQNPQETPILQPTPSPTTQEKQPSTAQKGGPPRTRAEVEERRRQVLQLYLIGLNAREIASQLNYPRRTISTDIQRLKQYLQTEFAEERKFIVNKTIAQLDEMWRQGWKIFHSPAATDQDPSFRKLAAMDRLLRTIQLRSSILGATPEPEALPEVADKERRFVEKLSKDEQAVLIRAIKRLESASPSSS